MLLLSNGVKFKDSDLENVGNKYSENRYYYNISNKIEGFKNKLPSEILLPQKIESSIYYNPNSNLEIKSDGRRLAIFYKNNFISKIDFNRRPDFFNKKINKNIDCKQVISMYGRHVLAIFSNSYCFFFKTNDQCKFCSLQPSRKSIGGENLSIITPEIIRKATKIALKDDGQRIKYFMYTCGTHKNEEYSYIEQAKIIRAVKEICNKKSAHHLTIIPTTQEKLLLNLKESGLDSIAFDLEIFDKTLFSQYCPGKEKYIGYDNFLQSFAISRKIFGHSNVKVGFVGGLEPLESLNAGMNFFGQKGISIAINVFHPDIDTELSDNPRPSVEYLFKMVKLQSRVYKKYKLKPVFPIGGRRSSLDTEIYRKFFD